MRVARRLSLAACLALGCGSGAAAVPDRPPPPEPESATVTASVTEPASVTASESETESHATETDSEPATESATESDTGSESGSKTETEVESELDAAAILKLDPSHSTSHAAPGNGRLEGGVALPRTGPGFIHNPRRPDEARYATVEMVQAIIRAAGVVERELPGSGLVVNDLSLREGGPIRQHGSHQNGRDADILFYALDRAGKPMPAVGVPLDPDGKGWDFKDLSVPEDDVRVRLDARRTWRFVQGLIEAAERDVQRIFVVEHVRTLLLAEAERVKAPRRVRDRFALVACQPGTPHDDHMHVRFYCAPDDISAGCEDKPPLYPWHRQELRALGLEPLRARPASPKQMREVAARTTTPAEARRKAGPMHWKVRKFLDRREAWLPKPSPGRPYCR